MNSANHLPWSLFLLSAIVALLHYHYANIPPYMDEIYHIPQAISYCKRNYLHWDEKITTFPGLYVWSVSLLETIKLGIAAVSHVLLQVRAKFDPWDLASFLRLTSCGAALLLLIFAHRCRRLITAAHRPTTMESSDRGQTLTRVLAQDAALVAWCVVLYPINFFYFPLYYTDTLSTTSIVAMYYYTLRHCGRSDSSGPSVLESLRLTAICSGCVLMRQTNVIWVCFCLGIFIIESLLTHGVLASKDSVAGALHAVFVRRPARALSVLLLDGEMMTTERQGDRRRRPCTGLVYPFLLPIAAFVLFVQLGNGGSIVLGDKGNHGATVHPANLCHCLAVLAASAFCVEDACGLRWFWSPSERARSSSSGYTAAGPVGAVPRWARVPLTTAVLLPLVYAALVSSALHPHPFILADNRHYVFYLWKRVLSIDPGSMARYSAEMAALQVQGPGAGGVAAEAAVVMAQACSKLYFLVSTMLQQKKLAAVAAVYALGLSYLGSKATAKFAGDAGGGAHKGRHGHLWMLVFMVAVCITTIPMSLIEPRYYSPAVTMYILNCGTLLSWEGDAGACALRTGAGGRSSPGVAAVGALMFLLSSAALNAATMFVFLYRPFTQATATATESELARFMY